MIIKRMEEFQKQNKNFGFFTFKILTFYNMKIRQNVFYNLQSTLIYNVGGGIAM